MVQDSILRPDLEVVVIEVVGDQSRKDLNSETLSMAEFIFPWVQTPRGPCHWLSGRFLWSQDYVERCRVRALIP